MTLFSTHLKLPEMLTFYFISRKVLLVVFAVQKLLLGANIIHQHEIMNILVVVS